MPNSETGIAQRPAPLAERMRPRTLEEVCGQDHLVGTDAPLRRALSTGSNLSLLFYGPPGTGKTTLARLIASGQQAHFEPLSGVLSNVSVLREVIERARARRRMDQRSTLVFIDEIHRFNQAQQDVLLPHVESGLLQFVAATTHNPQFTVTAALLSRVQIFELQPLSSAALSKLLLQAAVDTQRGLAHLQLDLSEQAAQLIAEKSDGDARRALQSLEFAAHGLAPDADGRRRLSGEKLDELLPFKVVVYDRNDQAHYDTISAFIKSIRGSDPDAALYWLAKMLHAGEDPRFIARRLVISASEDIGMADSNGLRVATSAFEAVEKIGMPEARIILGHATVYLASAPKSNRAYVAIESALKDVREGRTLAVPEYLRTKAGKSVAKKSGRARAEDLVYLYAHDHPEGYVAQAYLPEGRVYYQPSDRGLEARVKERLEQLKQRFEQEQKHPQ